MAAEGPRFTASGWGTHCGCWGASPKFGRDFSEQARCPTCAYDHDGASHSIRATIAASATRSPTSQMPRPRHAPPSERPFFRSQSRQIAHVLAPPSVSVQQSPHTERRQDAHGPAASALQNAQRSGPSSPTVWSWPLTLVSYRPIALVPPPPCPIGGGGQGMGAKLRRLRFPWNHARPNRRLRSSLRP